MEQCYGSWRHVPHEEWVHKFVHTLEHVVKNWYAEFELHHGTISWVNITNSFVLTFSIDDVCPNLEVVVRLIHAKVFDDEEVM